VMSMITIPSNGLMGSPPANGALLDHEEDGLGNDARRMPRETGSVTRKIEAR